MLPPWPGNWRTHVIQEVVSELEPEQRGRWERLWMASDRRGGLVKPLVYSHGLTGDDTLCFHTGGWVGGRAGGWA